MLHRLTLRGADGEGLEELLQGRITAGCIRDRSGMLETDAGGVGRGT